MEEYIRIFMTDAYSSGDEYKVIAKYRVLMTDGTRTQTFEERRAERTYSSDTHVNAAIARLLGHVLNDAWQLIPLEEGDGANVE